MEEEEEIFTTLRRCWYRTAPAGNKFIIFVRFGSSYTCSWEIPNISDKTIKENVEKAQKENEEYLDLHLLHAN
jgi:hypothetical protein